MAKIGKNENLEAVKFLSWEILTCDDLKWYLNHTHCIVFNLL